MNLHSPYADPTADADVYVACYASLRDWGGGLSLAQGAAAAASIARLRPRLVGVRRVNAGAAPGGPGQPSDVDEAPIAVGGRLWMLHTLGVARQLAGWLRTQPRPRIGILAVSPFWVVAARCAWPDLPVAYLFPCLLTNCLPHVHGSARGLHQAINRASIAWIERRAFRAASLVLAPTHLAREEIAAFAPTVVGRISVVPFGCHSPSIAAVDRDAARRRYGVDRADFVILVAGVLDRNKGFELAIQTLEHCPPRVRLLIAGDGPERARLSAIATRLGVSHRIRFLGSQSDMAAPLAACDAALSTSHYDTYPNILLEALAAGRPVIAPRHDPPRVYAGINELIAHGGGLTYERADANSLAEAIDTLAGDARRYQQVCAEASAVGTALGWESLAGAIREFARTAAPTVLDRWEPGLEAAHGI